MFLNDDKKKSRTLGNRKHPIFEGSVPFIFIKGVIIIGDTAHLL